MLKEKMRRAGFTLVEVIIAIAISSIVITAATRLLISVVNQYNSNNDSINLQTEVEEILNLMENVIMEADSVTLLEEDRATEATDSTAPVLRVDQTEEDDSGNTIYYYYLIFQEGNKVYESIYSSSNKEDWSQAGSRSKIYMGTHVATDGLSFTLTKSETAVFVDVSMENGTATYDASRKILLRNLTNGYKTATETTTSTSSGTSTNTGTSTGTSTPTTAAAEESEEETEAESESTAAELEENDISVTTSTAEKSGDAYTITIALKNNGKAVSWSDLTVEYYVNYPSRYNFAVETPSFTCISNTAECSVEVESLSTAYTIAVGKLTFTFTDSTSDSFEYGEEAYIVINVGNQKEDGSWGSLYESTNNASHLISTSYSAQSVSNVVVKSSSAVIWGTAPTETATTLSDVDIDILNFTVDDTDSTEYTISFDVKNSGKNIEWSDLDLKFYYITPDDETLECSSISGTSGEISVIALDCANEEITGATYSNATNYLKFDISDVGANGDKADGNTGMFYTDEVVSISFSVKYESGNALETSGSLKSFTNSHSLSSSSGNYMGVYYKDTLLSSDSAYGGNSNAYVGPETIDTTTVNMQVTSAAYSYSADGTECTVSFAAQNLGKTVNWSDVTLQYYVMIPSGKTMYIKDCSYALNGNDTTSPGKLNVTPTERETALEGSTHYITMGFENTNGAEFEALDSVAITFTIYYADGAELKDTSTSYGFQNSYSLDGNSYITIYHSGSASNPVWGTEPTKTAEEETIKTANTEVSLVVSNESYSIADYALTYNLTLTNTGTESVNLNYVQVRVFYYLSNGITFNNGIYDSIISSNYYPSLSCVSLDTELSAATGYIKAAWSNATYLASGDSLNFKIGAYYNGWPGLTSYDIDKSYSLEWGVAVYYKGELIYGSEPDDISDAYGSDDGFDEYPDTDTPTNLKITNWYSEANDVSYYYNCITGEWPSESSAMYDYYFYVSCENMPELDASKFRVRIYQYYDAGTVTESNFNYLKDGQCTMSSFSVGFGEDTNGYYIDIYDIVLKDDNSTNICFDILTYLKSATGADLNKCYVSSGGEYPVEIYYDGELVYPTS